MIPRKHPSDDLGTALAEALPWHCAIDEMYVAARALLDGAGDEVALALALHNYRETGRAMMGETGAGEAQEGRGAAYAGLSEMRYPG